MRYLFIYYFPGRSIDLIKSLPVPSTVQQHNGEHNGNAASGDDAISIQNDIGSNDTETLQRAEEYCESQTGRCLNYTKIIHFYILIQYVCVSWHL